MSNNSITNTNRRRYIAAFELNPSVGNHRLFKVKQHLTYVFVLLPLACFAAGATHVEDESGAVIDLSTLGRSKREKIAKELLTPSANSVSAAAGNKASAAAGAAAAALGGVKLISSTSTALGDASAASSSTTSTGGGGAPSSSASAPVLDLDAGASAAAAAAGGKGTAGVGIKRVWRHLLDDDIVLMNRQPTLHKPSIMAHR